jgi:hypothetical protein
VKMFCFRITDRGGEEGLCEECAKTTPDQNLYGVVSIADIEAADTCIGPTRDIAEYLLWEKGAGQILCIGCINKKRKHPGNPPKKT